MSDSGVMSDFQPGPHSQRWRQSSKVFLVVKKLSVHWQLLGNYCRIAASGVVLLESYKTCKGIYHRYHRMDLTLCMITGRLGDVRTRGRILLFCDGPRFDINDVIIDTVKQVDSPVEARMKRSLLHDDADDKGYYFTQTNKHGWDHQTVLILQLCLILHLVKSVLAGENKKVNKIKINPLIGNTQ